MKIWWRDYGSNLAILVILAVIAYAGLTAWTDEREQYAEPTAAIDCYEVVDELYWCPEPEPVGYEI